MSEIPATPPEYEVFPQTGELEQHLLQTMDGGPDYDFGTLPQTIRSSGLDSYTSWLATLTMKDPGGNERRGYLKVSMQTTPKVLLLPRNPRIGTQSGTLIEKLEDIETFQPIGDVHSHGTDSGLDPTDLRGVITSLGEDRELNFRMALLGTQGDNYLVVRTKQTKFAPGLEVGIIVGKLNNWLIQHYNHRENPNDPKEEIRKRIEAKYNILLTGKWIVENHKLGFYYSKTKKNGVFQLVTADYYRQALEKRNQEIASFLSLA